MTWNPFTSPIDYFKLAGSKSPGIATVAGIAPPQKWEERNGYGCSGATLRYLGAGLAKFDVELEFHTGEEYAEYLRFLPLIRAARPGERAKAMDIWHPYLENEGIDAVIVTDRTLPKQVRDGVWMVKIEFQQYRVQKQSLSKIEGVKAKPLEPVDQFMVDLVGQVQELAR